MVFNIIYTIYDIFFDLAFPNSDHVPAHSDQLLLLEPVAIYIVRELLRPKTLITFWQRQVT